MISILKTTSNFWVVPTLRWSDGKKKLVFRNGLEIELNWAEYRIVRDILSKGYSVKPYGDMFCLDKGNVKIVGQLTDVYAVALDTNDFSAVDVRGKVVLDVGGFIGDTAVLFSTLGASKVVIYEPVPAHQEAIKINMKLNGVNAEVHDEGLGDADGYTTIRYENTGIEFGLKNEGTSEMQIKTKSVQSIIEESNADVAKFDCEGAEINLVNAPKLVLRKIPFYMIEVHSFKIKDAICNKFKESGFKLIKDLPNPAGPQFSVLFFERT